MGFFKQAFLQLKDTYGDLFKMVSYDAGACSEENARFVVDNGKHYLLQMTDERRHMLQLAHVLFEDKQALCQTEDVLSNDLSIVRKIYVMDAPTDHEPHQDSSLCWQHTYTWLKVTKQTSKHRLPSEIEERYFLCSLPKNELTPEQWLKLVRMHWRIENNNHHTFDVAFKEDDKPMIKADPKGMLSVLILRRMAYTLLTLFRSVTLRSEDNRQMPWKALLRWVYQLLLLMNDEHVACLRKRTIVFA